MSGKVWDNSDLLKADREMVEHLGYTTGCTVCEATSGCDIDCIGCRERRFGRKEKEHELRARLEKARDEMKNAAWEDGDVLPPRACNALRMLEAILEGRDP